MSIDPDIFEPDEVATAEPYKIAGLSEADWALRKLAQARNAIIQRAELKQAEIDRLNEWEAEANKADERTMEFFEGLLRDWHELQVEADPRDEQAWKHEKNKTIKLPSGTLSVRKPTRHIEVHQDDFMSWAEQHARFLLRVKYEPNKDAIKKLGEQDGKPVTADGEVVPGVRFVEGEMSWKAVTE